MENILKTPSYTRKAQSAYILRLKESKPELVKARNYIYNKISKQKIKLQMTEEEKTNQLEKNKLYMKEYRARKLKIKQLAQPTEITQAKESEQIEIFKARRKYNKKPKEVTEIESIPN
jgi:hypothetical protein